MPSNQYPPGTLVGQASRALTPLEERLVCIPKARGSSPLSSTGQRPLAILKASKQSQTKSQSRRTIRCLTATARRGHGEGSVYRDVANGTWVGAISLGWRPDGSRMRRKVVGSTRPDRNFPDQTSHLGNSGYVTN